MTLLTDIHVRSFTGLGLRPYIHSVAKLRLEVFKEYPYFKDPDLTQEMHYLRKIASCREAIGVLIFDGTTLVGVSIGYPLDAAEPALLGPWKGHTQEINGYFYFENSSLLKRYRGRGIGHHFFDAKEAHVAHHKKYKHICFCIPDSLESDLNRSSDFLLPIDFWRKRGYIHHPEMKGMLAWKKIGEAHPKEHRMSFWVKDLYSKVG
jgi:hypothetical protein